MIRAMLDEVVLLLVVILRGRKPRRAKVRPPKALRQRGLSRTQALKYVHKANGSYQHPKQSRSSSQIQLAFANKRKGLSGLSWPWP